MYIIYEVLFSVSALHTIVNDTQSYLLLLTNYKHPISWMHETKQDFKKGRKLLSGTKKVIVRNQNPL